ncbi:hemolysin family protein [Brachybacterium sp. YJGR34]|uniref:hemolysin family protein n=1 Tax=Brachybacterium sp. YJGR34 TaxID=2059911 RepID=UPI000E0AD1FC|nr:hemolysin family protein [Brachybacterium sp. YJGR34]
MSTGLGLTLTLVLLALNAFFVGSEFALISARRSVIEPKALEGHWAAKVTIGAMEQISLMMAGAQMGITVASLALGAISEPAIAHLIEGPLEMLGVPGAFTHPIAFVIALALVTYLHVVFGEMVPKNIALAGPERMALILAPPMVAVVTVLRPLLWVLNGCGNQVLRILGVTPKDEVTSAFSRNEVAAMVSESRQGGLLEDNDEALLLGALRFDARSVANLVIPLDQVSTLAEGATAAQAEAAAVEGYSRFPVQAADGTLTGYVHIKDLLDAVQERRDAPIPAARVRTLPAIGAEEPLRQALASMQDSGAHLGAATDADGRVIGIVTLEDMLEELVGQIRDDSRIAA